jgi:hypothetical protein
LCITIELQGELKMIKQLIKLANHLDAKGLAIEADYLDRIIRKRADDPPDSAETVYLNASNIPWGTIDQKMASGGGFVLARRRDGAATYYLFSKEPTKNWVLNQLNSVSVEGRSITQMGMTRTNVPRPLKNDRFKLNGTIKSVHLTKEAQEALTD